MKEVRCKRRYEAPELRHVPIARVSAADLLGYGKDLTGSWAGNPTGDVAGYGDDLTGHWDGDGN